MTELQPDELFLRGRVQIEAALGALAHTGINPDAQQRLQTLLNVHGQLTDGQSQNDLIVYSQGETAEREKADIITSLDAIANSDDMAAEARLTASTLRELM